MATNHGAAVRLSKIKHSHSETTLVSHSFPTKNNKTNMFSVFLNVCLAFPACSAATLSCACAIWMFLWLHISYFLFFNFVQSECFFGFIFLIFLFCFVLAPYYLFLFYLLLSECSFGFIFLISLSSLNGIVLGAIKELLFWWNYRKERECIYT